MTHKPALALAASAGKRLAALEMAQEIERRGFAGIYCASFGDGLGLCEALALRTREIPFGTAIANIYTRHPADYALTATLIHELAPGRFRFGIGVSHAAINSRLGVQAGRPTEDIRRFVEELRKGAQRWGDLPPVVLATLRGGMVRLAGEIAAGAVWANAARSHMARSLSYLPADRGDEFFVGNMIPTCIADDRAAAAAVNRRTMAGYVTLPNYRKYWADAGYTEEMQAVERAVAAGRRDEIPGLLSDRWLADCTLFGTAAEVREGVEAWRAAGVRTPILVASSTSGGQLQALREVMAAFE